MRAFSTRLPKEPFILFVGAFRRLKGVDELIAAHQELESPPPLVMVGHQDARHAGDTFRPASRP